MIMHFKLIHLILASSASAWVPSSPHSTKASRIGFNAEESSTILKSTATPSKPETVAHPRGNRILSRTGHDIEAWKRGYTTCDTETPPTWIDALDLPSDFPVGTYYRNGHGRFESDDGIRVKHMFDGDGLMSACTIHPKDKKILFRNRFVRTEGYCKDKQTGTMSAPGTFGTRVSGGVLKNVARTDFKNVANTHCLYTNGHLYALWEGANPYKLDPLTLENDIVKEPKGTYLDGLLKPGANFAAHYRYDPVHDTYLGFGTQLDPQAGTTTLNLYELDRSMKSVNSKEVSAIYSGAGIIHVFACTENWYVFSVPPAIVNMQLAVKALLGLGAFAAVVDFQDSLYTPLILIPRVHTSEATTNMSVRSDPRVKIVNVPYHFSFQCANAFENDKNQDVIDMVLMNSAVTGANIPGDKPVWEIADWDKDVSCSKYVRFTVDPESEHGGRVSSAHS